MGHFTSLLPIISNGLLVLCHLNFGSFNQDWATYHAGNARVGAGDAEYLAALSQTNHSRWYILEDDWAIDGILKNMNCSTVQTQNQLSCLK